MPRIVTAPNRGTVHVVAGVLAGIGPTGPEGPTGPAGPATTISPPSFDTYAELVAAYPSNPSTDGISHIVQEDRSLYRWDEATLQWQNLGVVVGEPGQVQSVMAQFSDTSTQTISRLQWTDLDFATEDINDTTTYIDQDTGASTDESTLVAQSSSTFNVPHVRDEAYLLVATATLLEGGGATPGQRSLRLMVNGVAVNSSSVISQGSVQGAAELNLVAAVQLNSGTPFSIQLYHDSAVPADVVVTKFALIRVGGGVGPQGPQGQTGPQGDQGPKGDPGSAGGGYVSNDDLTSEADSTVAPLTGTPRATSEQLFPTPGGDQPPNLPYFVHELATVLERYVVARLTDEATFNARSSPTVGEVGYLNDTNNVVVRTGASRNSTVAYITSGEAALVDGSASTEAEGTLYVQYTVT